MSLLKSTTNTRTPSISIYSDHHPPIMKEFSLEIPDIPTSSVNLLERVTDSWRFRSDSQTIPEKKSFTDYAIVHNRTGSTDRTLSSVCENRNENENRESIDMRPVIRQRTDFSFGKQGTYSHFSDKTLETHFSNTENIPTEARLSTKGYKPKYTRPINTNEFKPSNLFVMTEKLSKAMKEIQSMENIEKGKEIIEPFPSENSQDTESKKETGNLMSLIKDYTKNPTLDLKIKMNKTSFIQTKKVNNDNKENTIDNPNLETAPNPFRKSSKLKDLFESTKDESTIQCLSAEKSSYKKDHSMIKAQGTLSASKYNSRGSTSTLDQHRRSHSGEKHEARKLNNSSHENSALNSHRRSLSCGKRRSYASLTSNMSSFLLVNEAVSGTTTMRKEHEQVILTLNDTLQKLLKRTEANREEINKLKEIKEEKAAFLQLNKEKLNQFIQQNVKNCVRNK